jgi:hypothetical protein
VANDGQGGDVHLHEPNRAAVERRIETMISYWERTLEHPARPFVASITRDHVDTGCGRCASRAERATLGLR